MVRIFATLLLAGLAVMVSAQETKHYDLKTAIDVKKRTIDVKGTVTIDFKGKDSVLLVLWRNTDIRSLKLDGKPASYSFDTTCKSPIFYIGNGGALVLRNTAKGKALRTLQVDYTCQFGDLDGWGCTFSDDWIELGFYTAWFPLNNESKHTTSSILISIDEGYEVSGSGMMSKQGKCWKMETTWPTYDNVILASKALKTEQIRKGDVAVDIVYTTFPSKDVDSTAAMCRKAYSYFSSINGKLPKSYLKFVISPFDGGGGYGRSKFFSLRAASLNTYLIGGIAHEMSHFWWHNAETSSWQDWLNEAFAEYSMILFTREVFGVEAFNKLVAEYREQAAKASAIWGIERESGDAYDALYTKGAMILEEFERKIGTPAFYKFLGGVATNKIGNTTDFLNYVENNLSKENRDWFENKLKN